jgi:acetate kinase
VQLSPSILAELEGLNSLAPLHQPHNLAGVKAFMEAFPDIPQIGCFDTSFHQTVDPLETRFALPDDLYQQGVRRYGFHGLSYDYVAGRLGKLSSRAHQRLLMAHLGNGSSLCAAHHGQSVATTMGFSALDGLMMGTRCGALDAGVLLYLLEQGWDRERITRLLYKQSGLLGVSGLSADMRTLRNSTEASARLAIDLYVHRVRREGGALVAVMQGLDAIAFTGGIGEHDAQTRAEICAGWGFLGAHLDERANRQADGSQAMAIHAPHSAVEVWVMPTDEGRVAAESALRTLHASTVTLRA